MEQLQITTLSEDSIESSESLYERQYIYKHPSRYEVITISLTKDDRGENGVYISGRLGLGEETIYWLQLTPYDNTERVQEVVDELNDLKQAFDLFYNSAMNTINQTTEAK